MCRHAFTLLEMMLVIFLIAMVTTFIVPTMMRAESPPAQQAAERFYGLLTQLRDSSQISGRITGVRVDNRRYRFMQYAQGEWQPAILRAPTDVSLPQTVQIALHLWHQKHRLTLQDMQLEMQQSDGFTPQVWFSPHAPPVPFSVQFRQQHTCWEVSLRVSTEVDLQTCREKKV